MKLLYFYFDFTQDGIVPEGYRGYKTCELNFGREFQYHMEPPSADRQTYLFSQTERCNGERIEPGFWGDNRIYNISALVGDNGAGKSMLIHEMIRCMMTSFHERIAFENLKEPPYPFAFLAEDVDGSQYFAYSRIDVVCTIPACRLVPLPNNANSAEQHYFNCGLDPQKPRKEYGILRKTKMIYFSNAVTPSDKTQYDYWNYFEAPTSSGYLVNTQYFSPLYDCSTLTHPPIGIRAQANAWKPVLTEIFNYSAFSKKELFPKLVQLLGVEVCPYCNRSFTTTVKREDGTYHRQNQVDHYVSKATHPWFALSLLNLIPCCGNCNQKKGDKTNFVLYPYFEEFGAIYRFRTKPLSGLGYLTGATGYGDSFQIAIEQTPGTFLDGQYKQRVENSIQEFGLAALYQENHNEFVSKIFEQRFLISDAYLDSLCNSLPTHFKSRQEIRHMLYLKSIHEDEFEQAPLSKLTHDIDWEIDDLIKATPHNGSCGLRRIFCPNRAV